MDALTLIGGRYRLCRRLASGGMGTVWSAQDTLLNRPVAVKILHPGLAGGEEFRRRFQAEARAAARLSHPGVVMIYDYGEDGDVVFLAMELVPGESLHDALRRRAPLSAAAAMGAIAQAADALGEAHTRGLVHRDVKPANLLVSPDGVVKVTDFGIARSVDVTALTTDGSVLGTVAYMSPEQIRGKPAEPPSDVYSLGVVAYESLVGVRPFPGHESIAVALSHLHDPIPPLPESVPGAVAALVTAMLAKDPALRPSARQVAGTARQLAAEPWAAGPPRPRTGLPPLPQPGRRTVRMRRQPSVKVLSAVTAAALVLGLGMAAALSGPGLTGKLRPAAAARPGRHASRPGTQTTGRAGSPATTASGPASTTTTTSAPAASPTPPASGGSPAAVVSDELGTPSHGPSQGDLGDGSGNGPAGRAGAGGPGNRGPGTGRTPDGPSGPGPGSH